MNSHFVLYFDGLCEPVRPGGYACFGWIIQRDGETVAQGKGLAAHDSTTTVNTAMYAGLAAGLDALLDWISLDDDTIEVRGDSPLVMGQMRGERAVQAPRLQPLYQKARRLATSIGWIKWTLVSMDENAQADQLSREAYLEASRQPAATTGRRDWDGSVIQALLNARLIKHWNNGARMLNLSNRLSPTDDEQIILAWARVYRQARDAGRSTADAAMLADQSL